MPDDRNPRAATTVLLVDDDARYRRALSAFLDATYDIDVVADTGDGDEAVALAERLRPDALVIDVAIPGSSGFEIGARAREVLPEVALVFVSGSVGGVDARRAEELGGRLLHKGDPLPVENALRALRRR
ncbi:MAG TPA: response regulator transcription factor [Gaiellaceae bacterium]|nr:response regulator transcription factor [Gaiellaceae bacterium]